MAQLPSALACHLSRVASSEVPLAWTAKSRIVVVPPHAAARVPVSKVSAENVPPNGISMCVCTSIPPGSTYLPVASMTRSAAIATGVPAAAWLAPPAWPAPPPRVTSRASTAAIFSPATSTSASSVPDAVTTVPPLISVVLMALPPGSGLDQRAVGVGPAVAVELPQVPDLGQLRHVQVAHQHIVLVIRGGVPD